MKKAIGILVLMLAIAAFTAFSTEGFLSAYNLENLCRRTALFGILAIGAGIVIMAGGIDLSTGSVVCLAGCLLPWLLVSQEWSVPAAVAAVIGAGIAIGLFHGVLVSWGRLQPFLVTLCGLLFYRGLARGFTEDQTQGFQNGFEELRSLATGRIPVPGLTDLEAFEGPSAFAIPAPVVSLIAIALLAAFLLRFTVWGRWLLASGRNAQAAAYSGIPVKWVTLSAFVLGSTLSSYGGMLFVLDIGSAQPADFGNFYELYAIAAAVLGGCSLRGGEGSVVGIVVGAALMQVLRNAITLVEWIPDNLEYAVIGAVILVGVLADELVRRLARRRPRSAVSAAGIPGPSSSHA
ncbi:MAG: ABC transporter permease [Phycisphaerales bacterium]